jgi:general stress protein 26
MDKRALEYLKTQRVGVLAVEMPDGAPHAATVHFAHSEDPLLFIFMTNRKYRKFEPVKDGREARASLVIGTEEGINKTIQMDGVLKESTDAALIDIYRQKFPEKDLSNLVEKDVILTFMPTWWRFSDFNAPEGKLVVSSD